jgi:hypothetical protein
VRIVREVSGTSWPMLTRTNYGEWAMTMKDRLRARWLWNAIDKGTDNEEDDISALEAILTAVPAEFREPLGQRTLLKRRGRPLQRCASVPTVQRRRWPSY